MKTLMLMFLIVITVGCAAKPKTVAVKPPPRTYLPATASALAFDPPVAMYQPMPSFSRVGRDSQAFYGYEAPTTDYYYSRTQDQQRTGQPDRVDRTSYSTRVGSVTR